MKQAAILLAVWMTAATAYAANPHDLTVALAKRDAEKVQKLLGKGVDPNGVDDQNGWRPLQTALILELYESDAPLTKILLDHGADANLADSRGLPLMFAAGSVQHAQMLLDHGADVNGIDPITRKRPLDKAIEGANGNLEVARFLIGRGAKTVAGTAGDAIIQSVAGFPWGLEPLKDMETLDLPYDPKRAEAAAASLDAKAEGESNPMTKKTYLDAAAAIRGLAGKIAASQAKAALLAAGPKIDEAEKAGDAAKQGGDLSTALAKYVEALKACPSGSEPDSRIRRKAISVAGAMSPPPGIPREAKRHASRAKAFVSAATGPDDLKSAISEFRAAAAEAPWLVETYYNLGLVQQKAGDYAGATASFKLYQEYGPKKDADQVQDKLDQLEALQERAAKAP